MILGMARNRGVMMIPLGEGDVGDLLGEAMALGFLGGAGDLMEVGGTGWCV